MNQLKMQLTSLCWYTLTAVSSCHTSEWEFSSAPRCALLSQFGTLQVPAQPVAAPGLDAAWDFMSCRVTRASALLGTILIPTDPFQALTSLRASWSFPAGPGVASQLPFPLFPTIPLGSNDAHPVGALDPSPSSSSPGRTAGSALASHVRLPGHFSLECTTCSAL